MKMEHVLIHDILKRNLHVQSLSLWKLKLVKAEARANIYASIYAHEDSLNLLAPRLAISVSLSH